MEKLNTHLKLGILFGAITGIYVAIRQGIIFGIPAGIISGFIFGFAFRNYGKKQAKKFSLFREDFAKSHDILYEGAATYQAKMGPIEGWLFLTSDGIFFKSRRESAHISELWIYFGAIKSVSTDNRGAVGNGLLIRQKDGSRNEFNMRDSQTWSSKIEPFIRQ